MTAPRDLPTAQHHLTVAAARYRLGLLPASQLPIVAMAAFEAGVESSALVELIGEPLPSLADDGPIFERALQQCSLPIPSIEASVALVLHDYVQAIASGELVPREGIFRIFNELYLATAFPPSVRQFMDDHCALQSLSEAFQIYDIFCNDPEEFTFEGLREAPAFAAYDRHVRQLAHHWLQAHVGKPDVQHPEERPDGDASIGC